MTRYIKFILLGLVSLMATLPASAQSRRISGTVSDDIDVVVGANVKEIDKNNRIVSQAITDFNGNFTMTIKDPKNVLEISYIGYKKWSSPIGTKNVFKVTLQDNTKQMKDVVVTAKKKAPTTGLDIPQREYAGAVQNFSMDDMEGLAFESVDQALQGQIAGLDIVANSGNLGSGTTMRLRGTTTINGNAQPLIVVNDHIFELPDDAQQVNFEDMDNEEQFSTLLNVNTEDIESITVLKDASSAAKWGLRGSNGVIEIKLRRGKRGPTRVTFTYKFNGTWQPDGYKMLDGNGYTMMLKEAYYNPTQTPTSIPELDYNQELGGGKIYRHFGGYDIGYGRGNTDWIDAVTQFGNEHRYHVNLSGGGEKAQFRIGAGYNTSTGSIIGQKLDQFTESTALDYQVSDRIKFSSNINMTFTTNHKNYAGILDRAYSAMPNMSIWEFDELGNRTGNYFNMFPIAANLSSSSTNQIDNDGHYTSYELRDRFTNGNPVANAYGAWHVMKQYNLTPQFSIEYKLLGKDSESHQLNYVGDVQLSIFNTSDDKFCPSYLKPMPWVYGGDNSAALANNERNQVSNSEYKSVGFSTRHDLRFYPVLKNRDHNLSAMFRFELNTNNSSNQNLGLWNVPNGITDPTVIALMQSAGASNGESRSHAFMEQIHYSYKSKYSLDLLVRTDGSTAFGRTNKYGTFPSVGGRWNIIDEPFMQRVKPFISMLAFRPTWGITGNMGGAGGGNQYNRYSSGGYYNGHSVVQPDNLSLTNLRCEKTEQWNFGFNLGLLDDLLEFQLDIYDKKTTDLYMNNMRIPAANGFNTLACINGGTMRNKGWDLNASTGRFAKVGKFSMRVRGNVSQNFNTVEEMNSLILENLNGSETWEPTNFNFNQRVQINNALGSIYGLKSKGVYRYDYDHNGYTNTSWGAYGYNEVDASGNVLNNADEAALKGTGYDKHGNPINTAAAAARRGENSTCPIAYDANGNMLTDAKGNPLPMYYCYTEASRYKFQGGDAIYEDINHDGNIDRYDMVYLGNSNPKWFGGFGFNLYYGKFDINCSFNFRIGNQIVNMARARYESMLDNTNQSYATTWRWRKNGDETDIPRALTGTKGYSSYNSLPSDRYVENGDYLRMQYIQLRYSFDNKATWMKNLGMKTLSLSATINNLFVLTKYTGVDPEVGYGGYGVATDNQKTPRAKSFTCNVSIGF
ncbi:MAG: SusC/RagA family TonB-linked outer membrane protein [Bacteroidaceae bacterium]|nr:SusC/RagA family TonB-linked outer membrane protein [Bacteroidaceae bacterium]